MESAQVLGPGFHSLPPQSDPHYLQPVPDHLVRQHPSVHPPIQLDSAHQFLQLEPKLTPDLHSLLALARLLERIAKIIFS
jgi:hypothetical protein